VDALGLAAGGTLSSNAHALLELGQFGLIHLERFDGVKETTRKLARKV
jgi:hypothetical protein